MNFFVIASLATRPRHRSFLWRPCPLLSDSSQYVFPSLPLGVNWCCCSRHLTVAMRWRKNGFLWCADGLLNEYMALPWVAFFYFTREDVNYGDNTRSALPDLESLEIECNSRIRRLRYWSRCWSPSRSFDMGKPSSLTCCLPAQLSY